MNHSQFSLFKPLSSFSSSSSSQEQISEEKNISSSTISPKEDFSTESFCSPKKTLKKQTPQNGLNAISPLNSFRSESKSSEDHSMMMGQMEDSEDEWDDDVYDEIDSIRSSQFHVEHQW